MHWPKLSRRAWMRAAFWSAPALALADALWLEPGWLKLRTLPLTRGPARTRFVHFTDLHHKGDTDLLQELVRAINRWAPEFVCFTGDLIEETEFLAEALEALREIQAPLYGVPGNHDYWCQADFAVIHRAFAATGGGWLLDQAALAPGGQVNLLGASCRRPFHLELRPALLNVALIHYPAWVVNLGSRRFDLVLAGHSHGGQVRLPLIGPLVLPTGVDSYDLGLYRTPAGPLYVGAGVGWFYLNVRFRCRPEVTLIEL
ncbi:MAG: hypothetical protein FJ387_01310 [Verrucomicrobia bacterium]|nr:hypothetical protein [Verrucomicrobiota bacterium]